jgi:hypothetical protein
MQSWPGASSDRGDDQFAGLPIDDPTFRRALTDLIRLLDRSGSVSQGGTIEAAARVVRHLRARPDLAQTLLSG